ncbi:MAG: PAS domain-containing protein, partial [bacterium]|nr:PAS domain-containing protein [bacterium]
MIENRYTKSLEKLLSSAKLLFGDFKEPVLLIDLEGRLIYCNKATETLGGFTFSELQGRFLQEQHINPAFAAKIMMPAVQKDGYWTGEVIVGDKNGREFPVMISASPIKEQKGKTSAIVVLVRDLSGRAQIEEEMARYLKDLEFLSDSASQFLRQESLKELYAFIAKQLKSLSGKSIIVVSDYDPGNNVISVRSAIGARSALRKLSDILGRSLVELALKTDSETRQWMRQGILTKVPDIYTLSFKQIPVNISKRIEKDLGLGDI